MTWISVNDRLPEEGKTVITYSDPYIRTAEILFVDKNGNLNWLDGAVCFDRVTHWMPLPDAPKQ